MSFQKQTYVFAMTIIVAISSSKAVEPKVSQLPSEVIRPKSLFENKGSSIRDPFFPQSTRAPYAQQKQDPKGTAAPKLEVKLALKGISGGVALINNGTFSEGESRMVKVPGGQIRIRCVKINERSVLINVDDSNEQTELRLQDK
jgi:hypothetical protein